MKTSDSRDSDPKTINVPLQIHLVFAFGEKAGNFIKLLIFSRKSEISSRKYRVFIKISTFMNFEKLNQIYHPETIGIHSIFMIS